MLALAQIGESSLVSELTSGVDSGLNVYDL
jgi:hypothetical protein